jgi:hypothetical protein
VCKRLGNDIIGLPNLKGLHSSSFEKQKEEGILDYLIRLAHKENSTHPSSIPMSWLIWLFKKHFIIYLKLFAMCWTFLTI